LGTSLTVYPAAGLVGQLEPDVPRLLINIDPAGADIGMVYPDTVEENMETRGRDLWLSSSCDAALLNIGDKTLLYYIERIY